MRTAWKIVIAAVCSLLLLLFASQLLARCGKTTVSSPAELEADSLTATRPDFDQRQKLYDSSLAAATRRSDSLTSVARRERVAASTLERRADSLAKLQDWHAAYVDEVGVVEQLRTSIATDSARHVADSIGVAAILKGKAELQKRLDVAELTDIPQFRKDLEAERRRSARQRWAGRLEGGAAGLVVGALAGAITVKVVSP